MSDWVKTQDGWSQTGGNVDYSEINALKSSLTQLSTISSQNISANGFTIGFRANSFIGRVTVNEASAKTLTGGDWAVVGTLSEGLRPKSETRFPLFTLDGVLFANVWIATNGTVRVKNNAVTSKWLQTSASYMI